MPPLAVVRLGGRSLAPRPVTPEERALGGEAALVFEDATVLVRVVTGALVCTCPKRPLCDHRTTASEYLHQQRARNSDLALGLGAQAG